jgi:hypothetical protein
VVVAAGLTACVPPVAPNVNLLPSEPERDTAVAFVAVTVRMEELPAVTDAGLAVIVTAGAPEPDPEDETVTVDAAVADPPAPVALAVYVVVADGVTVCVPPEAGRVYELPSEPVIVTFVAFVAATVSVAVAPPATVAGLDEILTVGKGSVILPLTPPHPTAAKTEASTQN